MSLVGSYDLPLFTAIFSSLYVPIPGLALPDMLEAVRPATPLYIIHALL